MDPSRPSRKRTFPDTHPEPHKEARVCPGGSPREPQWTDLPFDMQLAILADIPLAKLARLATLSKGMRAAYWQRLKERDSCIQGRLAEGWLADLPGKFTWADMAVPRDLVISPPIPERLQCTPHLNPDSRSVQLTGLNGVYRGFCLKGKLDGAGEWQGGRSSHVGLWRQGQEHGPGMTTTTSTIFWGEWHEGKRPEKGVVVRRDGSFTFAGSWGGTQEPCGTIMFRNGKVLSGEFVRSTGP